MPYRSNLIPSVVGALGAVAFLISSAFNGSRPAYSRVTGIIEKTSGSSFVLIEDVNSRSHSFSLVESSVIYLNDQKISFSDVENGRRASVRCRPGKTPNIVIQLDIFPFYTEFQEKAQV